MSDTRIHVAATPDSAPAGPRRPWGKIALGAVGAALLLTPAAPGAVAVWGLLFCWCWLERGIRA